MNFAKVNVFLCATLLASAITGCATHHKVYKVTDTAAKNRSGVYYILPKTAVVVTIPVTKATSKEGEFAKWAEELNIKPLPKAEQYSLGDATLDTRAVADPTQIYLVDLKGTPLQKRTTELQLTELGFMTDATSEVEDKTVEFVVKTFETVASVAAKVARAGAVAAPQGANILSQGKNVKWAGPSSKLVIDKIPANVRAALDRITEIRDERLALVSGQRGTTDITPESLNTMLKRLDDEEASLVRLFKGTITTETWIAQYVFENLPQADTSLFTISKEKGLKLSDTVKPVVSPPSEFVNTISSGIEVKFTLARSDGSTTIGNGIDTAQKGKKGVQGFYYRIPGSGVATLKIGNDTALSKDLAVAQFGAVASLPSSLGSLKKSNYTLSMYGNLGALKKLNAGSEPLDPELIGRIGTATESLIDTQQKRKAAEEAEKEAKREEQRAATKAAIQKARELLENQP